MPDLDELYGDYLRAQTDPPPAPPISGDDDLLTGAMDAQPDNPLPQNIAAMIEGAGYDADYVHTMDKNIDMNPEKQGPNQITETDLVNDDLWIEASKRLMPLFDGPATGEDPTDEEAAQWGLEMMGWFNYNIPAMALNVQRIQSGDNGQKMALYYMMNMYDEKEIDWNGTKRFFKGILTDPSTYLGLGTMGVGTVAGATVRQATRTGVKAALKASLGPTLVGAVEGGAYTSIDDALRQATAVSAGAQPKFDVKQNLTAGAVGTVAGGVLTAGGSAVVPAVKKAF
jgi:hypothetical protein